MFSTPEIVLTAVSSQHLPQTKAVFFGTVVTDPTRIHSSAPNFIDETDLVTTAVTESALIDVTESDTEKRHPALKPVDIEVKVKAPPQQKREAVKSSKSKAGILKKNLKLLKVKRIGHVRSIYVYRHGRKTLVPYGRFEEHDENSRRGRGRGRSKDRERDDNSEDDND